MKTSSAKAKGRRLQQRVRDDMRVIAGERLDPTDIESTTMGLSGVDIVLTKAAKDLFGPLAFECKNVELLNAVGVFQGHYDKYAPKGMVPIMVHSRNHIEPRVTMLWSDFVKFYLGPMINQQPNDGKTHYYGNNNLVCASNCRRCLLTGKDSHGEPRSVTGNSYGLGD